MKKYSNTCISSVFQPNFCTYAHIRPKNNMYLDKKDFVRYLHVREQRVRNLAIFKINIDCYHSDKKATKKSKFNEQNVYLGHLEI